MAELNGRPVSPEALAALALTNYGHFTTLRVEDRRARGLALHLDRLVRDCRTVFAAELDPERVRALLRRAVGAAAGPLVARVTVFDPALEVGQPGATGAEPAVLVTIRPAPALPLPPLRVRSVPYAREFPAVKHVGLFGLLAHRAAAQRAGYDDALFTDGRGCVSEGGTWNAAFHDGERLVWPDAECLPGVTMALLRQVWDTSGTAAVPLAEVAGYRAAFATNAAVGVRAIASVDGVALAVDDPVTGLLRAAYAEIPADPL
ncbi:aminotransferase class IV family protein [Kitasatospora sp. NPDC050543]|uniref:aminotransferase class IV family protein n=1 Tax=Kitasatospora sp. NPDC050543 TaxID=3364054 RepID=UPI0037B26B32